MSVVFIPTSSDDTLVAMCRREHAARVKQAIEACDVEKQYTVKVEVFEMGSDGETTRISGPSLFVGREGKLVVSSANGTLTLNVKLNESPAAPCDHAGKCLSHPIKTDEAQTQASDDDDDSDGPACCSAKSEASCTCPACLAATGTSCGNDCPADPRSNSASKVTHESSCRNKCSTGSSASGSHSGNTTAANSSALVGD